MGRISTDRNRQIGAATEKIAEGRKRGRACSCGKKYLQTETVGTRTSTGNGAQRERGMGEVAGCSFGKKQLLDILNKYSQTETDNFSNRGDSSYEETEGGGRGCSCCTANECPVIIQYKCLVPIYVIPEMKLLFPKPNYNVLYPSSYSHISVRDFYISRISLHFCSREICGPILGIFKSFADTCM